MRTGERLADAGELPVQTVLELAVSITRHSQVINRLLDYDVSSIARRVCFGEERGNRIRVSLFVGQSLATCGDARSHPDYELSRNERSTDDSDRQRWCEFWG